LIVLKEKLKNPDIDVKERNDLLDEVKILEHAIALLNDTWHQTKNVEPKNILRRITGCKVT